MILGVHAQILMFKIGHAMEMNFPNRKGAETVGTRGNAFASKLSLIMNKTEHNRRNFNYKKLNADNLGKIWFLINL